MPAEHQGPCLTEAEIVRAKQAPGALSNVPARTGTAPSFSRPTVNEQMIVLARAAEVFEERTAKHGEPWKEADAIDIAHMARHKVHRAYYSARRREMGEANEYDTAWIVDSCLDGINYLAFLIRLVEAEDAKR